MIKKHLPYLIIFFLFSSTAFGQTKVQEQHEFDEIEALKVYVNIFATLDTVEKLTRAERDNLRPSDWVENGTGLDGSGKHLRDAHEAMMKLAKGMDQFPQYWVDHYEKFNKTRGSVRKAAAALHALAVLVESTRNAKSSTAEVKLRSMSQLIKDTTALVSVNPAVSRYIDVMRMAIEDIADNAAIIEAATKKKNETVADVRKNLGITDYAKRPLERSPLQDAIDAAEERIEELERRALQRLDEKAYRRVSETEAECAKHHGMPLEDISKNRQTLSTLKKALRRISAANKQIKAEIASIDFLIVAAEKQLAELYGQHVTEDVNKTKAAEERMQRVKHELKMYREEQKKASKEGKSQRKALRVRFYKVLNRAKAIRKQVAGFDSCVRKKLAKGDSILIAYVAHNFPKYSGTTRNQYQVADLKSVRVASRDSSRAKKYGCLEIPKPVVKGEARNATRTFWETLKPNESVTKYITVPRGTEVTVTLRDLKGHATVKAYRKASTPEDISLIDINRQNRKRLLEDLERDGSAWIYRSPSRMLFWGSAPMQDYKIVVKCSRKRPASFGIHVRERDHGDLGYRLDAAGKTNKYNLLKKHQNPESRVLDLPLGEEFKGFLSDNDYYDMLRIPYLEAHTRVRVTLAVKGVDIPKSKHAWQEVTLNYVSAVCLQDGTKKMYWSNEFSVKHGKRSFLDFITDKPGHCYLSLRRRYGGSHEYRIKAEILEPVTVHSAGKLKGYLGLSHNGWYYKKLGKIKLYRKFSTRAHARRKLLERS